MVVRSAQCRRHKPEEADESMPAASVISQIYGGYRTTANVAHARIRNAEHANIF